MIIKSKEDITTLTQIIINLNKFITKNNFRLLDINRLKGSFSSSIYIDDLKEDIINIVYNLIMNHPFEDGNKRTGVVLLYAFEQFFNKQIKIINDDKKLYECIINLITHKIDKEEAIFKIFK